MAGTAGVAATPAAPESVNYFALDSARRHIAKAVDALSMNSLTLERHAADVVHGLDDGIAVGLRRAGMLGPFRITLLGSASAIATHEWLLDIAK